MENKETEFELDGLKKKEAIAILKRTPFSLLEVIKEHYFNKFGKPRHGVGLEEAEKIYTQTDKIIYIGYRNSPVGRKYSFWYRINKNKGYKLMFFLDKKPPAIFNAMTTGPNIEKKLLRKFGFMR